MSSVSLDLDGYTEIPAGKIAFVVTYLEMREKNALDVPLRSDVRLERWEAPELDEYRSLFRKIGADWLWSGRLTKSDEELSEILNAQTLEVFSLIEGDERVGLLELDYKDAANVEIAYFGLTPAAIGRGKGRWLMSRGIEMAWSRPETERLWLHTCTGDSPQALGFYQSCGYVPYKRAIEVADDVRLTGVLDPELGRHVPLIR